MTDTSFLTTRRETSADASAIVWKGADYSYAWLRREVAAAVDGLASQGVVAGMVVRLQADFGPRAIASFLALTQMDCIIVPALRTATERAREQMEEIAQVEFDIRVEDDDSVTAAATGTVAAHPLYSEVRERGTSGLVLFSSGSSGTPKGAVHDFGLLLEKFRHPRDPLRMLNFLLFDHWGGLNTMLHALANGGTVFTVQDRSADAICELIERHRVAVLPASPTFLNLLLLSGAHQRHDLSSLTTITYGTEPMPPSLLKRLAAAFPDVRLHQTYGLIEVGVMRSKSRSNDSVWVRLGGEGFQTRVVDGLLEIKAQSAMLGYLNAPSPFTEDGWFMTGDAVEVDGDYFRIIGRKSELINVGGEKVYPQEVESTILELDEVADVVVYAEKNALIGSIVCARVNPAAEAEASELEVAVKRHCRERLPRYKVPVKVSVVAEDIHSERFKKSRLGSDS